MPSDLQDHAYIYVVSEPYFGGDLMTCAQRASENGVALNQHWLAGILRQVCVPLARCATFCCFVEPSLRALFGQGIMCLFDLVRFSSN